MSLSPVSLTAVSRRQTQTCCGLEKKSEKKRWLVLVEQDVENELLNPPTPKEILFFLLIQGCNH